MNPCDVAAQSDCTDLFFRSSENKNKSIPIIKLQFDSSDEETQSKDLSTAPNNDNIEIISPSAQNGSEIVELNSSFEKMTIKENESIPELNAFKKYINKIISLTFEKYKSKLASFSKTSVISKDVLNGLNPSLLPDKENLSFPFDIEKLFQVVYHNNKDLEPHLKLKTKTISFNMLQEETLYTIFLKIYMKMKDCDWNIQAIQYWNHILENHLMNTFFLDQKSITKLVKVIFTVLEFIFPCEVSPSIEVLRVFLKVLNRFYEKNLFLCFFIKVQKIYIYCDYQMVIETKSLIKSELQWTHKPLSTKRTYLLSLVKPSKKKKSSKKLTKILLKKMKEMNLDDLNKVMPIYMRLGKKVKAKFFNNLNEKWEHSIEAVALLKNHSESEDQIEIIPIENFEQLNRDISSEKSPLCQSDLASTNLSLEISPKGSCKLEENKCLSDQLLSNLNKRSFDESINQTNLDNSDSSQNNKRVKTFETTQNETEQIQSKCKEQSTATNCEKRTIKSSSLSTNKHKVSSVKNIIRTIQGQKYFIKSIRSVLNNSRDPESILSTRRASTPQPQVNIQFDSCEKVEIKTFERKQIIN
jgi:hypothetical protein